jgi:hypothetical protein
VSDEWRRLTLNEWHAEGRLLFGNDVNKWEFVCPSCGLVQTRQDFLDLGMSQRQVDQYLAYSCIGRWRNPLESAEPFEGESIWGCRYSGGLLPNVSPITLIISEGEERPTFGFSE